VQDTEHQPVHLDPADRLLSPCIAYLHAEVAVVSTGYPFAVRKTSYPEVAFSCSHYGSDITDPRSVSAAAAVAGDATFADQQRRFLHTGGLLDGDLDDVRHHDVADASS
jgi:hypothetical protein